jgi:hypothetical protein
MGMDTTDPEVKRAIKVVEKMVEKKLKEREGSEKALSEKVEKIEKNYENLTKAEKAREIQTQAKAIVNSSQLEGEDKQMLMHMFLGKYDVDSMQPDEIMEALQEETKTYEARLKKQGLLKNKEYVDKKTETGKKAGTDVGGTGGRTEADPTLKGLKGREYKNRKEEILMEIANKYLNKSK